MSLRPLDGSVSEVEIARQRFRSAFLNLYLRVFAGCENVCSIAPSHRYSGETGPREMKLKERLVPRSKEASRHCSEALFRRALAKSPPQARTRILAGCTLPYLPSMLRINLIGRAQLGHGAAVSSVLPWSLPLNECQKKWRALSNRSRRPAQFFTRRYQLVGRQVFRTLKGASSRMRLPADPVATSRATLLLMAS